MPEFLYSIGGFVIALGILVTVHEFGHFWVARRLGVKVLRFSIGFGRPLWLRRGKRDGTEYVIAAIPLGGYVKMLDENEEEVPQQELHRAFNRQPLWKRVSIVLAGPMFNFLFAILAYWMVFVAGVDGIKPIVGRVIENSLAQQGGFRVGDEIVTIDGKPNRSWDEHRLYLFSQAFKQRQIPVEVVDVDGARQAREIDLRQLPLSEINSALLERGIGLLGYIPEVKPIIGKVQANSPADAAGLRAADRIVGINGQRIDSWLEIVKLIQPLGGKVVRMEVERSGQSMSFDVVPERMQVDGKEIGRVGIEPSPLEIPHELRVKIRYGPAEALKTSLESTWTMSILTIKMLVKIVQLEVSTKNISGPLTIAQYAGHTVRIGFVQFLVFLAVVSISLGVLNLLPIPILDGGHLLYYLIEAIKGGPLSKEALAWGQQVGIVLLFALMSLAFYNDIVRLLQ
jgi:regulator of sigma E protease